MVKGILKGMERGALIAYSELVKLNILDDEKNKLCKDSADILKLYYLYNDSIKSTNNKSKK